MLELKLVLDFACYGCEQPVIVTVKCAGKGLASAGRTVAAVNVPCPHCNFINEVCFEPSGVIQAVRPYRSRTHTLEPSVN